MPHIWGGCECYNYFEARSGVLKVMLRMLELDFEARSISNLEVEF
jgi:hypothetical protein